MDVPAKARLISLYRLLLFWVLSACGYASASTELLFCYEDKALTPMFLGVGDELPIVNPSASIDILKLIDNRLDNLHITYLRKPWRRCLQDLAKGQVDAVIASYRPERAVLAVYPMTLDNKVAHKYAITKFSSCLFGREKFHQQWQNREVFQKQVFTLAVPNGYGIPETLKSEPFFLRHTFSSDKAFELLKNNVVDASIGLCQIDDLPIANYAAKSEDIAAVYPAYQNIHGYLLFSNSFYKKNTQLSKRIWQQLGNINTAQIYVSHLSSTSLNKANKMP